MACQSVKAAAEAFGRVLRGKLLSVTLPVRSAQGLSSLLWFLLMPRR